MRFQDRSGVPKDGKSGAMIESSKIHDPIKVRISFNRLRIPKPQSNLWQRNLTLVLETYLGCQKLTLIVATPGPSTPRFNQLFVFICFISWNESTHPTSESSYIFLQPQRKKPQHEKLPSHARISPARSPFFRQAVRDFPSTSPSPARSPLPWRAPRVPCQTAHCSSICSWRGRRMAMEKHGKSPKNGGFYGKIIYKWTIFHLVGGAITILNNMSSSMRRIIPYIYEMDNKIPV